MKTRTLLLASFCMLAMILSAGFLFTQTNADPRMVDYTFNSDYQYDLIARVTDSKTGEDLILMFDRETADPQRLAEAEKYAKVRAWSAAREHFPQTGAEIDEEVAAQQIVYAEKLEQTLTPLYYEDGVPAEVKESTPVTYAAYNPQAESTASVEIEDFESAVKVIQAQQKAIEELQATMDKLLSALELSKSEDGTLSVESRVSESGNVSVTRVSDAASSQYAGQSNGNSCGTSRLAADWDYGPINQGGGGSVGSSQSMRMVPQRTMQTQYERRGLFGRRVVAVQRAVTKMVPESTVSAASSTFNASYSMPMASSSSSGTCSYFLGADGVWRQVCN